MEQQSAALVADGEFEELIPYVLGVNIGPNEQYYEVEMQLPSKLILDAKKLHQYFDFWWKDELRNDRPSIFHGRIKNNVIGRHILSIIFDRMDKTGAEDINPRFYIKRQE